MVEVTKYEPGTPSWVDLGTPDLEGAKAFYGALFGWQIDTDPNPAAGGYAMCTLRGKPVAGLGPQQAPGKPWWTTYVTVADLDATVETAQDNGGKAIVEPMDVMDVGRMAVLVDPEGATISLWQPLKHIGAEIVNEPGAFCWNELATRDLEGAKTFYRTVFGWDAKESEFGDSTYVEWKLGDKSIAGMMPMGEGFPPEMPPSWAVYFAVDDTDAAVAKAQELGGRLVMPPMDTPAGRFAVLSDPQGAVFSVIKL